MKYFLKISYDGSHFYGFQRLNDCETVQKKLEEALSEINKKKVLIKGAGRTDRGVHALGQCIHFNLDWDIPLARLKEAIQQRIEPYIKIVDIKIVDDDFHARFSVSEKTYLYKIYQGEFNPFLEDYYLQFNKSLDIEKMKEAAQQFIGIKDYRNYVAGKRDNYVSQITEINIVKEGDYIYFTFIGKSFYRYMIRNLVGALIQVGLNKYDRDDVKISLYNFDYKIKYTTVKSNGLYLVDIKYD